MNEQRSFRLTPIIILLAASTSAIAIGLADVTGEEADKYKFKVPTLRNVEMTYP